MIGLSVLKIAFDALIANKLRSSLTLLGVIFGVTSVMTIVSALEGMMGAIEEDLNSLGPSTFMVGKMMIAMSHDEFIEKNKRKPIEMDDYEAIAAQCETCDKISPRTFTSAEIKHGASRMRDVGLMGGTFNFIDIVDFSVAQGRFHSSEDDFYRRRVAFIGNDVREEFFSGVDPLGKEIKIAGLRYTVIGVAKAQGASFGESRDKFVIIPLSAFYNQFGSRQRGLNLIIRAKSVADRKSVV